MPPPMQRYRDQCIRVDEVAFEKRQQQGGKCRRVIKLPVEFESFQSCVDGKCIAQCCHCLAEHRRIKLATGATDPPGLRRCQRYGAAFAAPIGKRQQFPAEATDCARVFCVITKNTAIRRERVARESYNAPQQLLCSRTGHPASFADRVTPVRGIYSAACRDSLATPVESSYPVRRSAAKCPNQRFNG